MVCHKEPFDLSSQVSGGRSGASVRPRDVIGIAGPLFLDPPRQGRGATFRVNGV